MTTLIRNTILSAAVLTLPGCLAINAMLGAAGLFISGPVQYAGTVYSVGEYAYEYAVNDKTPDEVIQDKFAWLTTPDTDPRRDGHATALARGATLAPASKPAPATRLTRVVLANTSRTKLPPAQESEVPATPAAQAPEAEPRLAARTSARTGSPTLRPSASRREAQAVPPSQAEPREQGSPREVVTASRSSQPDPMQVKRDRMEQGLAMAERLMNRPTVDGIRYSVHRAETGVTGPTLSGSWSIRHPVMQAEPDSPADAMETGTLVTAQLSS